MLRASAASGHVVKWNDDGTFGMGPGWGSAANVRFDANVYLKHGDVTPMEANAKVVKDAGLEGIDWEGPVFDAVRDGGKMDVLDVFFEMHGRWMRTMFQQARVI